MLSAPTITRFAIATMMAAVEHVILGAQNLSIASGIGWKNGQSSLEYLHTLFLQVSAARALDASFAIVITMAVVERVVDVHKN